MHTGFCWIFFTFLTEKPILQNSTIEHKNILFHFYWSSKQALRCSNFLWPYSSRILSTFRKNSFNVLASQRKDLFFISERIVDDPIVNNVITYVQYFTTNVVEMCGVRRWQNKPFIYFITCAVQCRCIRYKFSSSAAKFIVLYTVHVQSRNVRSGKIHTVGS